MHCFKTIAVCRITVIVSAIMTFTATGVSALNAPYLTSATPTNDHSIALTWRNNDFAATQVLILRKTGTTAWVVKDSVAGTIASYVDSSLVPLTGYSFALLAAAPGLKSDTSNSLTTTTLKTSEIFAVPGINVIWIEGQKFITIRFFDSSNTEKGFRLYRKSLTDPWVAIDSIITKAPDTNSWKSFVDSNIADNKWYTYKLQIYNDSQTAFYPETTVYNYVRPKTANSYVITKKGSIPAKPISWVERIGDSLYFPEVAAPGDTEITLIDVSNSMSPQFRAHISPKNIPVFLRGSPVEAHAKIGNYTSLQIFAHRLGCYIVSRNNTIYQYDSASLSVRDSVQLLNSALNSMLLNGWLNDTCCLISYIYFVDMHYSCGYAMPVCFGTKGIDTFPRLTVESGMYYGLSKQVAWGCYNNKLVIMTFGNNYLIRDFSLGYAAPLTFSEQVSGTTFANQLSSVFDTSVTFTTKYIYDQSTGTYHTALYAFSIADAHSGPDQNQSSLGKFEDLNYTSTDVQKILVDSEKRIVYLIGSSGINIYSYLIQSSDVHPSSISRNSALKRLSVSQNPRGVSFSIIGAKMQSLQVLNARGQIVRSVNISAGETFLWNRQDNAGRVVPVGFYIYKIGTLKDGMIAGTMALVR